MQRQSFHLGLTSCACMLLGASAAAAQGSTVASQQKISQTAGGFGGLLADGVQFGWSSSGLGDLDGDGVGDLAVGEPDDSDGGGGQGAVWILFLDTDGTVKAEQKISETMGGFGGVLDPSNHLGWSVSSLGDLDDDGITDLATGAYGTDSQQGAVWILFLNTDGTVKAEQKISETVGGFGGVLDPLDSFGYSLAALGDLDGDGVEDLAVGAPLDGGQGAVWILFLNANGTVKDEQKIAEGVGGFGGAISNSDEFASSLAMLDDLDGDAVVDLAIGEDAEDDGGANQGAVWIVFLNTDGTVKDEQKISETMGGFGTGLDANDLFGVSVASPGDVDGDGRVDLAVGALFDDDGGTDQGAVWLLFLNANGTVKARQKISETAGGFGGSLDPGDHFACVSSLGDLDGDGIVDIAVGARFDDDGGSNRGAVWILFLGDTTAPVITCPADIAFKRIGSVGAVVDFVVEVSDNADPSPTLVCVPPSGSFFPVGTTSVTCTAYDASGNSSMCSFDVTVRSKVRRSDDP